MNLLLYLPARMLACDFESIVDDSVAAASGKGKGKDKRKREELGENRNYLKIWETLPAQLLNAYGEATFNTLKDSQVWEGMTKPIRTGANWMTEYASADPERRGVAANRWLKALLDFMEYHQREERRKENAFLMKESTYKEFYEEIIRIMPSVSYCLAPKKVPAKEGAASLRASVAPTVASTAVKTPEELDRHAKILYEWLDNTKKSYIRGVLYWQSAGGLSFVAATHHRATQCFVYNGNTKHEGNGKGVSLVEFQDAIKDRHRNGSSGIEHEFEAVGSVDYHNT